MNFWYVPWDAYIFMNGQCKGVKFIKLKRHKMYKWLPISQIGIRLIENTHLCEKSIRI